VRNIASVQTLTVLPRLGNVRKGIVLQFLYESGLIKKDGRIIDLSGADLWEAHLREARLSKADLTRVKLGGATLSEADLSQAELSRANLSDACLRYFYPD
jgi:uncharacterized protein YjbI with pentapeptide repeats